MNESSTRAPGRLLAGRYALERRLGSGGAGVVWYAHDRFLDRTVAVKLLHGEVARDPVTAARFRTEAATAAKLTHPNAVIVYDIGHDEGDDYLVMEMVEGATLAEVLVPGPLAPGVAAGLGAQIARALGAAHAHRLVHRDVKPANVLVTAAGVAKVADFGIARAFGEAATRLTLPGHVMGTARYLAPEQLRDEDVDARADVYALGVLLHETLTGQIPFGTGTLAEVASRRLVASLPPVSEQRADVPALLDEAIARATQLDPDDRFVDGEAFALELARASTPDAGPALAARVATARAATSADRLDAPTARPGPGVPAEISPSANRTSTFPTYPTGSVEPAHPTDSTDSTDSTHSTRAMRGSSAAPPLEPGDEAAFTVAMPASRRPATQHGRETVATGDGSHGPAPARADDGPPEDVPEPTDDHLHARGPSGRRLLVLSTIVALAMLGVGLAVAWLPGGEQPTTPTAGEETDPDGEEEQDGAPTDEVDEAVEAAGDDGAIEIVAARDHDPFGSGEEHRDDVPNAFDDDPSTTWQTQRYRGVAELGGLKPGVGIWAELAGAPEVTEVVVEVTEPGASYTLYAGDSVPDPNAAPADWGTALAEVTDAEPTTRLTLAEPTEASVWLLWFTSLPPDGGQFRASVSNIELVSS